MNIPTKFLKIVNELKKGKSIILNIVISTIHYADNWKDAQLNITKHMDTLIQEAEKVKVDLCGAEEVILQGWCIADITGKAEEMEVEITEEQAISVLENLKHHFDASIGINWDTIGTAIYEEIA